MAVIEASVALYFNNMKLKLADIIIGERQRIDMGNIEELADSLKRLGQIHNIGVNEDGVLIWGMRRYLAAKSLGWETIEGTKKKGLTVEQEQEIELEEDIKRKDRSWQEKCLAVAKLFRIKGRNARAAGEPWNVRLMASFTGISKSVISEYVHIMADELSKMPRDPALWEADNYSKAIEVLRARQEHKAQLELERRRDVAAKTPVPIALPKTDEASPTKYELVAPSLVPKPDITKAPLTLRDRAMLYNKAFEHHQPPNTQLFYINKNGKEFIHAFWFCGGGNISSFYGAYQIEYLKRVNVLFADLKGKQDVIHLFSGSIPPSDDYSVVGLPDAGYTPDIVCDAHKLSSVLPFKPKLIYADPPYSIEDSEHYANAMVNRERVLQECAIVLQPGGFICWIDQALPIFNGDDLEFVGAIGYIRSTANRFRLVTIFRKPITKLCPPNTESAQAVTSTTSPSMTEFV